MFGIVYSSSTGILFSLRLNGDRAGATEPLSPSTRPLTHDYDSYIFMESITKIIITVDDLRK